MEETHQKKIEDLQRQHQRELEKLREEKDRLLAEETAATISGKSVVGVTVAQANPGSCALGQGPQAIFLKAKVAVSGHIGVLWK